jgi:hypothetical protein
MAYRYRVVAISVVAMIGACDAAHSAELLASAHAHNDYWHERPLLDALDRGFTSVEADIFEVGGKLLVGHARGELKPERTLESLYLEPLAQRVKENGGRVQKGGERFFLLVDIKSDAQVAFAPVQKVLAKYADILTVVDQGEVKQGPVTVVISGNRPIAELESAMMRYAGIDGRLSDLNSDRPAHLMPMISDNWTSHFTWRGDSEMPAEERRKLREIVDKVHNAGRVVRFWATPETQAMWRELRSAGVDLIGTDQIDRLATFLRDET